MRLFVALLVIGLVVGCGQNHGPVHKQKPPGGDDGHKHGGDEHAGHMAMANLVLQTREGLKTGVASKLRFTILDAKGVPIKEFAVNHDAKVHLILISQGLQHFAHIHPSVDPKTGVLTAEFKFPTGGAYHLFADFQQPGQMMMTATTRIEIAGDTPPASELRPDVPGVLENTGITAKVSVEGARRGVEARVRFEIMDGDKPIADLEPYMGAMGHLVVVSADAKQYVHAHPDEKTEAKHVVTFGATFPEAGLYKGWGQFKREGEVRILPFVVRVD